MFKRLFLIIVTSVTLSGCFMAPMALIGPVTSGFSTASIIQSGVTSGAGYIVKQTTGKSVSEHALSYIDNEIFMQTYLPNDIAQLDVAP